MGAEVAGPTIGDSPDEGWIARRGVGAGQHVGVTAANEPALVAMLYALWGLGAVAVPIGVRAPAAETARLLAHARAGALGCTLASRRDRLHLGHHGHPQGRHADARELPVGDARLRPGARRHR